MIVKRSRAGALATPSKSVAPKCMARFGSWDALLQFDQAGQRAHEDQDGDGEAEVAERGELAEEHLQAAVGHGRHHRAIRLRRLYRRPAEARRQIASVPSARIER